jgi:hypothetical protein
LRQVAAMTLQHGAADHRPATQSKCKHGTECFAA